MKKLVSILFAIFLLIVILNSWSGVLTNQIADYILPAQVGKQLLSANVQLQRALASTSVGLAVNEDPFFDEALKRIEVSVKQLDSISVDKSVFASKLSLAKEIQADIKELLLIRKEARQVSKENLLNLNLKVENLGEELNNLSRTYWDSNIETFEGLIGNFDKISFGIHIFQFFSLFLFAYLVLSIYRKNRAEETIKKNDKLHSLLFSSLSEAVFLCDDKGTIKLCNYSCSLITGVSPQQIVGSPITHFIQNEIFSSRDTVDSIQELVSKGVSYSGLEMTAKIGQEHRWYSVNAQPVVEQGRKNSFLTILSLNDITSRVKAKRTIQNQQIQLLESAKLQSIGEMASGIAHEINNPLAVISTSSTRLSWKAEKSEMLKSTDVKRSTDLITKTVDRMAKIIRSLLKMSRKDKEEFEEVTIGELVNLTMDFCQPLLDKMDINLNLEEMDGSLKVLCSPTQISQVLLNLIKNSADAISELPERWIKIKTIDSDQWIQIEVIDSGKGISKELQEQVLLPFFSTKPVGEGTGLGLSISRKILEVHKGELGVDTKNPNTAFYIKIPRDA